MARPDLDPFERYRFSGTDSLIFETRSAEEPVTGDASPGLAEGDAETWTMAPEICDRFELKLADPPDEASDIPDELEGRQ